MKTELRMSESEVFEACIEWLRRHGYAGDYESARFVEPSTHQGSRCVRPGDLLEGIRVDFVCEGHPLSGPRPVSQGSHDHA